jgi:hypothetical protein
MHFNYIFNYHHLVFYHRFHWLLNLDKINFILINFILANNLRPVHFHFHFRLNHHH